MHFSFFLSFVIILFSWYPKETYTLHNMSTDKLVIFDTTLRDGEQVNIQWIGFRIESINAKERNHPLVSWCHFKHRGKDWDCKDSLSSWCRCPRSRFPHCLSRWFRSSATYCQRSRPYDGRQREDWSSYGKYAPPSPLQLTSNVWMLCRQFVALLALLPVTLSVVLRLLHLPLASVFTFSLLHRISILNTSSRLTVRNASSVPLLLSL